MVLDKQFFIAVVHEFYSLGGREVNLTGGEPTMFPGLEQLVDSIHRPEHAKLSLTTNGCDIEPLMRINHKATLSKLNVSLHGWDKEYLSKTISPNYDLLQVCNHIRSLAHCFKVCINFTLMKDNRDQFQDVAEFAMAMGVQIKVINFQETRWNEQRATGQFVDPYDLTSTLTVLTNRTGSFLRILPTVDGYGALLRRYVVGQTTVTVVDGSAEHKTMGACNGCQFAMVCKEGFYAIRLYSDGTLSPCLHRADLAIPYRMDRSLAENIELLLEGVL